MTGIQLYSLNGGSTYDLLLKPSLVLGETTPQNQTLLLATHKGEWKERPMVGVGLADIINDHDLAGWRRLITEQFEMDGQCIDTLKIDSAGLTLEAHYK